MNISNLPLTISSLFLIISFSGCEEITQFGKDTNTTENNETQINAEVSIDDNSIVIAPTQSEETSPETQTHPDSNETTSSESETLVNETPKTETEPEVVISGHITPPSEEPVEEEPETQIPTPEVVTDPELIEDPTTQTPTPTNPTPEVPPVEEPNIETPTIEDPVTEQPVTQLPEVIEPVLQLCQALEITAASLNVRINPNTVDEKIATAQTGEQYVVVARDGNWANTWFDEETRWVYAKGYTQDVNLSCGKVINTNSLNVRTGASTSYAIAGSMSGDSLWVYATPSEGTWKNIWYKSESLWVHGSYLEEQYTDQVSNDGVVKIIVESFNINNNDFITETRFVNLALNVNTAVSAYQVSEDSSFTGAQWLEYSENVDFTLSAGDGVKQLYLRVKDATGRLSEVVTNSIELQEPVVITDGRSIDRDLFYAGYRSNYGGLNGQQVTGLNYLLDNFEEDKEAAHTNLSVWSRQIAYLLATTKHEVANTYTPITEYGTKYCANYDGGCTYKGRGYVQLTHKYNYSAMSAITGANLVDYPTRALEPDIAYTVMSYGSFNGIFTSRKLGDYIKVGTTDYYNARRVINGTDKATLIKGYAETFQSILNNSAK